MFTMIVANTNSILNCIQKMESSGTCRWRCQWCRRAEPDFRPEQGQKFAAFMITLVIKSACFLVNKRISWPFDKLIRWTVCQWVDRSESRRYKVFVDDTRRGVNSWTSAWIFLERQLCTPDLCLLSRCFSFLSLFPLSSFSRKCQVGQAPRDLILWFAHAR